jgi:hypothetical protein
VQSGGQNHEDRRHRSLGKNQAGREIRKRITKTGKKEEVNRDED